MQAEPSASGGPVALAGLVLCGGRSSRMGVDKALIEVGGQPLVLRAADILARVADPVLLATGQPGRLGALGYQEIGDERPDAGPLGGIVAGLAAAPHDLLAVLAVDLPFASGPLFVLLARLSANHDAVVPLSGRGTEPLHAVYARRALPRLRAALRDGVWSMRRVLGGLRVREVEEPEWRAADPSGRFAWNLNRREDLALVRREAPQGPSREPR